MHRVGWVGRVRLSIIQTPTTARVASNRPNPNTTEHHHHSTYRRPAIRVQPAEMRPAPGRPLPQHGRVPSGHGLLVVEWRRVSNRPLPDALRWWVVRVCRDGRQRQPQPGRVWLLLLLRLSVWWWVWSGAHARVSLVWGGVEGMDWNASHMRSNRETKFGELSRLSRDALARLRRLTLSLAGRMWACRRVGV